MTGKFQLPDQLLDMVTGGTLYFRGEVVTAISSDLEGVSVTTASGEQRFKFGKPADGELTEEFRMRFAEFHLEMGEKYDVAVLGEGLFVKE